MKENREILSATLPNFGCESILFYCSGRISVCEWEKRKTQAPIVSGVALRLCISFGFVVEWRSLVAEFFHRIVILPIPFPKASPRAVAEVFFLVHIPSGARFIPRA